MGARKKISAEKRKEALKTMYFAKLQNVPTSLQNCKMFLLPPVKCVWWLT